MFQKWSFILFFYWFFGSVVSSAELFSVLSEVQNKINISSNISIPCVVQIGELIKHRKSLWALQMLDASSKVPNGLLQGNMGEMGDFDECIQAKSNTSEIHGKYCLGHIAYDSKDEVHTNGMNDFKRSLELFLNRQQNAHTAKNNSVIKVTSFTWAACLPNKCSVDDFNTIFGKLPIKVVFEENNCQTYDDALAEKTPGFYIGMAIFMLFLILIVVSSLYDYYCFQIKTSPKHPILVIFSAYTNASKLFATSNGANQFHCLNGIKVLSMFWVLIGHNYSMVLSGPTKNYIDIYYWANSLKSMLIVSGPLSVDSFLLMGGCLMTYSFLKAKKNGVHFNLFMFYFHRYLRLTPAVASMVLAYVLILPYFGSGPNWPAVKYQYSLCNQYWWTTLLYVQNYVNVDKLCLGQSWYLSLDMQMYFLSPIILFPLRKWPKTTLALLGLVNIGSMCFNFWLARHYKLSALLSSASNNNTQVYMNKYYLLTHTRVGPWLIGIFLGYIIFSLKENLSKTFYIKNKIYWTLLWIIAIGGVFTCVFVGHSNLRGEYNEIGNSLHIALVRPSWAISVALIIYACVLGYGGPINWFLSLPIFQIAARFTYGIYLIHYTILLKYYNSTKVPLYFADFSLVYSFWGVLIISTGITFLWILAFESPIIALEKILFRNRAENRTAAPRP